MKNESNPSTKKSKRVKKNKSKVKVNQNKIS